MMMSCHRSDPAPTPSVTPPYVPLKQILWDGEMKPLGVGWVSPEGDSMSISIEDTVSRSSKNAVSIHMAKRHVFLEAGWQWSSWVSTIETNLKSYQYLHFSIRIDGPLRPDDLSLSLVSPGDHHTTKRLNLSAYATTFLDGEWHDVSIPLNDFYTQDMKFDPARAVQIIVGLWNENNDFVIYLDDLFIDGA